MIRENRNLLINAAIALLLGLAFMLTFQAVYPTSKFPAYEKLFKNASSIESVSFVKKELVYDVLEVKKGSDVLGYIYKGKGQNAHSGEEGYVDIQIGINKAGVITGVEFLELTQTDFKVEDIKTNANYYKDKNISELDLVILANKGAASYDVVADASLGSSIIRGVIREAIIFFTGEDPVEVDPILEVFPTYATAVNDDTFVVTDKVVQKQIIKSEADATIGHLYKVTAVKNTGTKVDYHENEDWTLTFLVGLDLDGKIVKIFTLESDDTAGFYKKHNAYLESLIGKDMLSYDDVDNTVTGATFSRGRILELLDALKGVLA